MCPSAGLSVRICRYSIGVRLLPRYSGSDPGRACVRILVIGATGLIGSAVCARLAADGHMVVGASRHRPPVDPGGVKHVALDIANGTPSDFAPLLSGIDAVV